ncbi:MAG: 50S ribosomal protein L24e [Thermoproteota archaeon]
MPTTRECSYCGHEIEPGTGLMYVLNNGSVLWFCSRKCFTFWRRKTDPRRLKWTKKYTRINR